MSDSYDIAVIGGGVIGLGLAGELAGQGLDVVVLERGNLAREASYASGGMIAPVMELENHDPELFSLGQRSLEMWDEFGRRLQQETEGDIGLRSGGTLYVSHTRDQQNQIERLYDYQCRMGASVDLLRPENITEREPLLTDQLHGGIVCSRERWVNNRRLCLALLIRCKNRGVDVRSNEPVVDLNYEGDWITDCETETSRIQADKFLITAGAWSASLPGLRPQDQLPVRPVKGEAVSVQVSGKFLPEHIIRTPDVYCVPHPPERLIIGATSEEKGFDNEVTSGAVLDLLAEATAVLPDLEDQPLLETWSGHRPATRDNLPVLGPSPHTDNLWFATGHYRSGILLLPVTVRLITEYIKTGNTPDPLEPYLPARFLQGYSSTDESNDHKEPGAVC